MSPSRSPRGIPGHKRILHSQDAGDETAFSRASRKVRPDRCLPAGEGRSKCNLFDRSSSGAGIQNRAKWRGTFGYWGRRRTKLKVHSAHNAYLASQLQFHLGERQRARTQHDSISFRDIELGTNETFGMFHQERATRLARSMTCAYRRIWCFATRTMLPGKSSGNANAS